MKRWSWACFALLATPLLLPAIVFAQNNPTTQTGQPTIKYLKITVKSAKLWPTKPSGKCWDPCFMKKYKLPPRGAKNFSKYFDDKNFQAVCKGTSAPDGFVEVKIGKYEVFTTDKINNVCDPKFNVGHVFRVTPDAPFTITVYDNDGAAGFQAKRDLMGVYTAPKIPAELINGGTLVLKNFGQVEQIVLESKVVTRTVSQGCEGVYKIRIVEVDVHEKKESGKPWDRGISFMKKPDIVVNFKLGNSLIETPKQSNTFSARFTDVSKTLSVKKGTEINIEVLDKDGLGKSEIIGSTAESDVCKIINNNNAYTFKDFGRVKKVVVIFEKQK